MPVWKMRLGFRDEVLLGDQEYSFNGHVLEANTASAWARAEEIASAFLEVAMPTTVFLTSIGVSNPDVVNGTMIVPQNSPGMREVTGDALPGWNAVRFQFTANIGTRVHVFYPRVGLTEDDVTGQTLTSAVHTALTSVVSGILAGAAFCDKDGFLLEYGAVSTRVQMRQMGWRRRHKPGFKRGWVPV